MGKSLANWVKNSPHPAARAAKWLYRSARTFTLPAPRVVTVPMRWTYLFLRATYAGAMRIFICEPIFKSYCKSYGARVRTGECVHWISGHGDLVVGDDVLIDGRCAFVFAALFPERPALVIGDHTVIANSCTIAVARRVEIGRHCMLAADTWIVDSPGHPADPAARLAHLPPRPEDVKPVKIGDNVWIGRACFILPGVTIGEGSVVSAGSVVTNDVPPYTIVAGYPARKIGTLQRPADAGAQPAQPGAPTATGPAPTEPVPSSPAGS
jgi:acetyltransferase-like isoleucine patch superfamily enzyme